MPAPSTIDWLPPISLGLLAALAVVALVIYVLVRWLAGPPAPLARRWELFLIRCLAVVVLAIILAGPVRVERSAGVLDRPRIVYLLDASQSMALGDPSSRWDQACETIGRTATLMPQSRCPDADVYTFGRRLSAIESARSLIEERGPVVSDGEGPRAEPSPTEVDTQLLSALRQLPARFAGSPPRAVVLLSDGQARDPAGAEEIAARYARMQLPIHTVCCGDVSRGGDVAVVGMVVPDRARKYSEVSAHVVLRSFGYADRRCELRLDRVAADGSVLRQLRRVPITLADGVQCFEISFSSDIERMRIRASIPEFDNEVSVNNNEFQTQLRIDRTKIRVLYIEGGNVRAVFFPGENREDSTRSILASALTEDPDIECTVLLKSSSNRLVGLSGRSRSFPENPAELFAYDALILSNVSSDVLSEQQLAWIDDWIKNRGGGICMLGGPSGFAAGGGRDNVIGKILPATFSSEVPNSFAIESRDFPAGPWDTRQPMPEPWGEFPIRPTTAGMSHPIWNIVADEKKNREIIESLPLHAIANQKLEPKVTAEVLAVASSAGEPAGRSPALAVGPYGKGRSVAMATNLAGYGTAASAANMSETEAQYLAKFWRNVIYWLTENSLNGRRRLQASTDKILYRPGEVIKTEAVAYDESVNVASDCRIVAVVEPASFDEEPASDFSPLHWPGDVRRTSGEHSPYVAWSEELELAAVRDTGRFSTKLPIAESPPGAAGSQTLRIEVSAYEDFSLIDSMSIHVQILDDPFERQNPLPNPRLLETVASRSGGKVVSDADALAAILGDLPISQGPPIVKKSPAWDKWWILALLMVLLTVEWAWRRHVGLA